MKFKSCVLGLCMAAITSPLLAALPEVELIRTAAPIATPSGVVVGGHITSDPIQDSDGDLLRGDLEVTFTLNATSANSYTVNGLTVTPGASETFVFNFDATGGRLNVPVSVNGSGSVSTDDYDLSIRVPGLIEWTATPVWAEKPSRLLTSFFGPDNLIWLAVEVTEPGPDQGLGIIKLDVQGNVVDSFRFNSEAVASALGYAGLTPDGNVILSGSRVSVIVAPDGSVVVDYPHWIYSVSADGTIYREHDNSNRSARKLGRLSPNGDYAIANHFVNLRDGRPLGDWGVYREFYGSLSPVDNLVHVRDGVATAYDISGIPTGSKYGADGIKGFPVDGWIHVAKTGGFIHEDGRARYVHAGLSDKSHGFTISSQGEWLLHNPHQYSWYPGSLIKISADGTSAKAATVYCNRFGISSMSKGAERDGRVLLTCGSSVQLINLSAESKFSPLQDPWSIEDLIPSEVGASTFTSSFAPAVAAPSSGTLHKTVTTYPINVNKP